MGRYRGLIMTHGKVHPSEAFHAGTHEAKLFTKKARRDVHNLRVRHSVGPNTLHDPFAVLLVDMAAPPTAAHQIGNSVRLYMPADVHAMATMAGMVDRVVALWCAAYSIFTCFGDRIGRAMFGSCV